MRHGIVQFTNDVVLPPAVVAKAAEDRGFATFYVPEHTHIPVRRTASHPTAGAGGDLPTQKYYRILDPWISLATVAAVTDRIGLSTAVALPGQADPITLAKQIATLDHLSGGRVCIGGGWGWNTDEAADHGVPANRRRTYLREKLEAMRALWTQEEASYHGKYVSFDACWQWPKPVQAHIPFILGAAPTEQNFGWIVAHGDGWLSTPRDDNPVPAIKRLNELWDEAGRQSRPDIRVLTPKTDLAELEELGVTEVVWGVKDETEDELLSHLDRVAAKAGL